MENRIESIKQAVQDLEVPAQLLEDLSEQELLIQLLEEETERKRMLVEGKV